MNLILFLTFLSLHFLFLKAAPVQDNIQFAKEYLTKYGYYTEGEIFDPAAFKLAIEQFQRYAGVEVTGDLNKETLYYMNLPRCSEKDLELTSSRFLAIRKWNRNTLTYKIANSPQTTTNLQGKSIDQIIQKSLNDWTSIANLFVSPTSGTANINMGFYSGDHGDNDPFDGPGKTLAHAAYPQSGLLHFDNSENWSDGIKTGINLRQVATHELGHVFGLGHSTEKKAIMYPWYLAYDPFFALDTDDISGIVQLYGRNPNSATVSNPSYTTTTLATNPIGATTKDVATISSSPLSTTKDLLTHSNVQPEFSIFVTIRPNPSFEPPIVTKPEVTTTRLTRTTRRRWGWWGGK